jgi:hypothetical protein
MPLYVSCSPLCHRAQKSSHFFYNVRRRKWFSYYTVNGIRWKNGFKFLFVYFKHCHHYDFHFRSQILYSSDELKARQCRHPDIGYQDLTVFTVTVKVSILSSTISIVALSSFSVLATQATCRNFDATRKYIALTISSHSINKMKQCAFSFTITYHRISHIRLIGYWSRIRQT